MYHPGNVNVPEGAGALWAQAGKTALAAGQQVFDAIRNSSLNPEFRARMKAAIKSADLASTTLDYAQKHPGYARKVTEVGPGGTSTLLAPAQVPVAQQMNLDLDTGDGDTGNKGGQQPTITEDSDSPFNGVHTGKDAQGNRYFFNVGTKNWELWPGGKPSTAPNTSSAPNTGASPPPPPPTQTHQQQMGQVSYPGQSLYAQGGGLVPTSPFTFRVATPPPPAPFYAQGGGEVPAASQQPTPGAIPDSLSDQYAQAAETKRQQDLADWQAKTQTEPLTADDAMSWIRRKTTLAKDATYMQHGGPNGEPAYAFHMRTPGGKGTGVNVVPVSQMIQDGAAPTAASQNTSVVLSQSDKLKQQQQNALVTPPAAPTDQTGQVAQQPGQPTQQRPSAPAPSGGYDPTPYQQAVAQATANPQNLMAQTGEAGAPAAAAPADHPARTQAETGSTPQPIQMTTSPEQVSELNTDADAKQGKRTWQTDDTGRFTTLTSPRGGFYEQRFYRGTSGWQDGLWTPDNQKRQEVLDTYGSASSNAPRGQVLDYDQIKNMSMPEIDGLLAQSVWWKNHPTGSPPDGSLQLRLNAEANASRKYAVALDMANYAQQHNIAPKTYNEQEILQAAEAATRDGVMSADDAKAAVMELLRGPPLLPAKTWPLAQYAYHNFFAGGGPKNAFAYALGGHLRDLTAALDQLPEYHGRAVASPDWPTKKVGIEIPQWNIDIGAPVASDPSKLPQLNTMVTGASQDEVIRNYTEMKKRNDEQYVKDVKNAAYAGIRVPDDDMDNMLALSKGQNIKDDNNPMRDKQTGALTNPYGPPPGPVNISPSPTPSPAPSPTPSPASAAERPEVKTEDLENFIKNNPGKSFTWKGQPYRAPTKP